jgi:hypothetical protein
MVAAACVSAPTVFGQRMFGGGPRDFGNADMAKIFGKNQAFTAMAETMIADKQHSEPVQMEMSYAFLKGNLRTEMDMTSMKGTKMPPEAVAQMKQMGMDRTASIYRGDKKLLYLVYPGLKSYCEITPPPTKPADKPDEKAGKVDITQVGKETIDGHSCVKNKITFTSDDGSQHEMLTWQASDLSDFPIKTEMHAGGSTITTHFRDIKLSAPDASLFDPPTDYTRYGSMQEMMMASMSRMMPQGGMPHGEMPPAGAMPPHGGMPPRGGGDNE